MKILLPYNTNFGLFECHGNMIVKGGIENFCRQIYDAYDDVEVLEIDNTLSPKVNTDEIKSYAKNIGADIIISNWIQASFAGAKIMDSEVPILVICHENSQMMSVPDRFRRLNEAHHSLVFMSTYQKMKLDEFTKRIKHPEIQIDGYINSSYCKGTKPKLLEPEWDICTIGRCDPRDKKPFLLKSMLANTNVRSLVMSNSIRKDDYCYNYYQKHLKKWNNVLWDLEYNEVMKNLSKSKTFFQTWWNETWGMTSLEALSRGVPTILNTKDDNHGSMGIAGHATHYKNINFGETTELVDAIISFEGIDRLEIQDMTWYRHTFKNWKNHLSNLIDRTIEKHKTKTSYNNLVKFM